MGIRKYFMSPMRAYLEKRVADLESELQQERERCERLRTSLRWALTWAEDAVKRADNGYGHQEFKREARDDLREAREALEE